jgi:hypothetical protein
VWWTESTRLINHASSAETRTMQEMDHIAIPALMETEPWNQIQMVEKERMSIHRITLILSEAL